MSSSVANVRLKKQPLTPAVVLAALGLTIDLSISAYLSWWEAFGEELEAVTIEWTTMQLALLVALILMVVITMIYTPMWFAFVRKHAIKGGYKELPTTWLILIPIYGYLRLAYKHGKLMEELTQKRYSWAIPFLLALFVNSFAMILFNQYQYNLLAESRHKSAKK